MKRIRLLLAAVAAMVAMGINAQGWTAQAPADGDYYLYNVGTGKFLSCGEAYGTQAVVNNGALNLTLVNNGSGAYTLYTTSSFTYGNPNAAQLQHSGYVDQNATATTWTFDAVDGMENTYTLHNAQGTYLTAPSNGTILITMSENAPTDNYGYWKLINKANLFSNASKSTPIDVTCLINDANFESNKNLGWNITADNKNLCGGLSPNKCAESYCKPFYLSQTINNVPNGLYGLKAQGFYRKDKGNSQVLPRFFINGASASFPLRDGSENSMDQASTSFANGNYTIDEIRVWVVNNTIVLGAENHNDNYWCIWDNFQLTYYGPSETGEDVANIYIKNTAPTEESTGWTVYNKAGESGNDINPNAFDGANNCAEFWNQQGFSIKQSLSNMPIGYYQLNVVALQRDNGTGTINLNNTSETISYSTVNSRSDANTWFNAGNGVSTITYRLEEAGNITIGLTANNKTGDYWTVWRGFELNYLGEYPKTIYKPIFDENVAEAERLYSSLPTSIKNTLKAVVDEKNIDYQSGSDYIAASEAVSEAIEAARPFIEPHARFLALKSNILNLKEQTDVYDDPGSAVSDFETAVNAQQAAVDGATTVTVIENAITGLRAAAATFLGAVTVKEDQCFDITTSFLENTDFSNGTINGWETNYVSGQQAQNIGYQDNNSYNNGDNISINQFIEAWRQAPTAIGDGYLRQTVSSLPEGKYVLEADVIATNQNNNNATTNGAYLYINADNVDYKTSLNTNGGTPLHFSTEFMFTGEGDVIFGLKTESTDANWIAADNFKVKFYGIDLSPYETLLANEVSNAAALNGTVPTAVYSTLNDVVSNNNETYTTSKEYSTAISNIQSAITTAKVFQPAYAHYQAVKTAVLALDDDETIFTGDATVNTSSADTEVEAATTVEAINNAIVTLRRAAVTFLSSVTVNDNKYFDITNVMIDNPTPTANADYWTVSMGTDLTDGGYKRAMNFNTSNNVGEFYRAGSASIKQTLAGLPAGYTTLSVQAFTRSGLVASLGAFKESDLNETTSLSTITDAEVNNITAANTWFNSGKSLNELTFELQNNTNDIEIGITTPATGDAWTAWRSFTLKYLGTAPTTVFAAAYEEAKTLAETARDDATYANITGEELTALINAINATPDGTVLDYQNKITALNNARETFTTSTTVNAYNNYKTNLLSLKEEADNFNESIYTNITLDTPVNAAGTATALESNRKKVKVAEYNYVRNNYTTTIQLGEWTSSAISGGAADTPQTKSDEHWSASTHAYNEQGAKGWGSNSWTVNYNQTITLPAGEYVFKVAGRKSANVTLELKVENVSDSENPLSLGTVSDFPEGASNRGINTSGATDFETGEGHTYANSGNGYGWEWRYVPFTLDTSTDIKISIDAEANASHCWVSFCDYTVQAVPSVAAQKVLLNQTIANATVMYNRYHANAGTGVFQFPISADADMNNAITTAQSIYESNESTIDQVNNINSALNSIIDVYPNQTLNAPAADKRYTLTTIADGKDWNGNAITFIADGSNSQGGYSLKYKAPAKAYMNQALKFTAVDGETNTYKVSALNVTTGAEQYLTTLSVYDNSDADKNLKLRTTDDASKAMWVRIEATSTSGQFKMYNVTANSPIAHNNNDDLFTRNSCNFTIAEASQASVPVSAKAGKFGTIIFPFTPNVTEGFDDIKFYQFASSDNDGVRVNEVEKTSLVANMPYLVKNTGSENFSKTLTGWGIAAQDSYNSSEDDVHLTGVYTDANVPENSYVLQDQGQGQKFYKVNGTFPATPYRVFLVDNSGNEARFFNLFIEGEGVTNGIDRLTGITEQVTGVIYDLQGRKVQKPGRGMYIINGKKVVIK